MKMKRFAAAFTAAALALALAACGGKDSAQSAVDASGNTKIRVGTMAEVGGSLVQYAQDQGYFAEEGLAVDVQLFATGVPINEALAANEVDIGVSGMASLFSLANGNTTWIGETNSGSSGLGIYVREDNPVLDISGTVDGHPEILGDATTASGMEVLGPVSTSQQYHVVAYAKAMGLPSEDVPMINMEQGPALTAFQSGQGDAISASPPNSFALEDAGYQKISDFDMVNGSPVPDGVIVDTAFMEANRDACVKFLKVLYRAADEFNADTQKRFDFSMDFFTNNGKQYTDSILEKMIEIRPCWDKDYMTQDSYTFGQGLYSMISYYIADGKISESQVPAIKASFDVSLLEEALGAEIQSVDFQ